jgi:hypothetical protein
MVAKVELALTLFFPKQWARKRVPQVGRHEDIGHVPDQQWRKKVDHIHFLDGIH